MFLVTFGVFFIASFGQPIQIAFYEKTEIIVADYEG